MADTGIFCTTLEVQRKAGLSASATSTAEAYINDFVTQAESFINVATRRNWSDIYSTLNVDVKGILKECASNLAAIYCINYDMSGATQTSLERIDSENKVNILMARLNQCIAFLLDDNIQKFIIAGV